MSTTALSIFENKDTWELAGRMAASLAKSTIVPKDFQNNANNALIAIELAYRLNTSPIMVMQNLYIVYGRPSWSAQYMIAMINGSGKYDMELQFDEKSKNGKPFSCQCWTEKNGRRVTGPVIDMDMAEAEGWIGKSGSKWKTMPQIMLRYRAASFFGRMNCPELTLGIYTREEVVEIGEEDYTVRDMAEEVKAEIAQNANSVPFTPQIEQKPEKPKIPEAAKETAKETEPAKAPQAAAVADAVVGAADLPFEPDFMGM